MTLSGLEFKKTYGKTFYKVLRPDLIHHGFRYRPGLNIDTVPFDPSESCKPGGLYFADIKNLLKFLNYGNQIAEIEIPDDSLVYIENNKFKTDKFIIGNIITNETEILQLLKQSRDAGCPWNESTCEFAAKNGHLEVLKWVKDNGCPWNEWTCVDAALNGHLDVLKWARDNGCLWNSYTCHDAALNGHLEVLKWARDNGCPWNERTCANAAANGHLEVLKWARENGCPWNKRTFAAAAANGHVKVLKWARDNGCPWDGE